MTKRLFYIVVIVSILLQKRTSVKPRAVLKRIREHEKAIHLKFRAALERGRRCIYNMIVILTYPSPATKKEAVWRFTVMI